jgi:hypothetical protein
LSKEAIPQAQMTITTEIPRLVMMEAVAADLEDEKRQDSQYR